MSRFEYNKIEIGLVRTESINYAPQFDEGGSYLYTNVDITVSGLVNPKGTSYAGDPGGVPVATADVLPSATINAIRSALLQPLYSSG